MDIPRFPAPECFRKDEKKTRNISNRVSVWVNFSVKNHKKNETEKRNQRAGAFAESPETRFIR